MLVPRSEKIIAQDPREPHAVDLQLEPTATWQYALDADPTTMSFHNEANLTDRYILPSPIFDSGKPPVSIVVSACSIDWPLGGDMFVASPPENPQCVGKVSKIRLVPFGVSRRLRSIASLGFLTLIGRLPDCELASSQSFLVIRRKWRRLRSTPMIYSCKSRYRCRQS